MLDDAMNNTSVILLFEVGDVRLLFPRRRANRELGISLVGTENYQAS